MRHDHVTPERIRIGPANWSPHDWEGRVYPTPKPHGLEPLMYWAQSFDTIEINSTFYRIPAPKLTETWDTRVSTNPQVRFTNQQGQGLTDGGTVSAHDEPAFTQVMAPLQEPEKRGAALIQCPSRVYHPSKTCSSLVLAQGRSATKESHHDGIG